MCDKSSKVYKNKATAVTRVENQQITISLSLHLTKYYGAASPSVYNDWQCSCSSVTFVLSQQLMIT